MVKGVEKGYILKIENFVKINVHIPLKVFNFSIEILKLHYFINIKCTN